MSIPVCMIEQDALRIRPRSEVTCTSGHHYDGAILTEDVLWCASAEGETTISVASRCLRNLTQEFEIGSAYKRTRNEYPLVWCEN